LVSGTDGGRRHDEHVDVTVNTNCALFMVIYSAAFVPILSAGQYWPDALGCCTAGTVGAAARFVRARRAQ